MAKIIHVGQMKSGTTFIQQILKHNKKNIMDKGFLYPGELLNQQHACYGICGKNIPWVTPNKRWTQLGNDVLEEINSATGNVIMSAEALSCMNESGIEQFVESLGGIDKVVITVRNLHKTLSSAWQQSLKGGSTKSINEFFHGLVETRQDENGFWRNYAFGNTAKWWAKYAEVNIVVASESNDKYKIWEDFSSVVGLPDVSYPAFDAEASNSSLYYEDAEILRLFNSGLISKAKDEREIFLRILLKRFLFPSANGDIGTKILPPKDFKMMIDDWGREEISKIPSDVNIVGDLLSVLNYDGKVSNFSDLSQAQLLDRMRHIVTLNINSILKAR